MSDAEPTGFVDEGWDAVKINKVFHDHECAYYDERFAIGHDDKSAAQALREVEGLLGRELLAGERVLDVGCGTGFVAAGLRRARPDVHAIATDLSRGMLDKARAAGADPVLQCQAELLPFPDASIDLVVARGVLHHLPDVRAALVEWRRVLRPGGSVVLLSEPTPTVEKHGAVLVRGLLFALRQRPLSEEENFWELASMAANLHVFTKEQLVALCQDAGFDDVELKVVDFFQTLVITASYVVHGRVPGLARRLPWRHADGAARLVDRTIVDRLFPERARHTIAGVLRS